MKILLRYPLVAGTVAALLAVLILLLSGQEPIAQITASSYALAVAAYLAVGMVRRLMGGQWGIDILAVTAIVSTVLVGEFIAAMIIVLMMAGGTALEDFAAGRAKKELTSLLERVPQTAHREGDGSSAAETSTGGQLEDVAATDVRIGDILLVRPGEVVPLDGILLSESGSFDESSLTGESLPVERVAGDGLMSGSLNGEAAVRMRVTALMADSQYSRIVALVKEAADSKAPMVRLADRYAVPFTALAYLLGAIGWIISGSPARFAEVLVVATPCPLLIAAPVAFLGGMSRAARGGIIVKYAGVLEQLSRIKTVAFDKTGTLTYGRPSLVGVRTSGSFTKDDVLALAASAEQYSSHVLAASVMEAARNRGLVFETATEANEFATHGVRARFDGRDVVVGKPKFVAESAGGVEEIELASGELAIYVGVAGEFAGALVMSDPIRGETRRTLAELTELGVIQTVMLTGDALATAEHIADAAGLTDVRAECLPADKVEAVRDLPLRPVMMVGDGVNDAPVLAAADVGIAMGARGSTAAGESADVVIILDDLSKVAAAVRIGQRTIKVALQSIWIGIALSVALMLAAAAGFVPAIAGALSQELVDLATILNALRALSPGTSAKAGKQAPAATGKQAVSRLPRSAERS
ncbi:heavy metal translocating P-type ATPase [Arthrobacter sp. AL08]|uniref:heavy metal translocating P-type ATPase n=1 Tax=Micrococcaceae TaxID=1268 RepID=UPI001CFF6FF3|nr:MULTISPECIES: heavy metal translocating P-type ATPase [Micrococcaceae]MDD1475924.1 heavy metal translocating P-type ATPase [Arthrobacter sp. H16F315]MCB5282006.1 Zinc-transporting ATPase [Arthrobacter sp. ES1]MDI3241034.1 heavy metal translocating P-type ATPase [Arthrobacter sp. AL05]MDI3276990.1 heavy metal translocating P-type ATPase [Arthrobacter sp. AL08]MDJ0352876.1 heavy metal translocating P-type ATPase [Pseudarthrobacter sp. PH31-O2]